VRYNFNSLTTWQSKHGWFR